MPLARSSRALEEGDLRHAGQVRGDHAVIGLGVVGVAGDVVHKEGGARHADGLEQVLAHKLLPSLSGKRLDEHAHRHKAGVLIAPVRAEGPGGLHVAQVFDHAAAGAGAVDPVGVVPRQARAVAEQVARRGVVGGEGVHEPNPGQVFDHGLVPVELALVHQHRGRRRGKGLGAAADLVEGVRVRLAAGLHVRISKALAQLHLAVLNHAHGDGGLVPHLELRLHARLHTIQCAHFHTPSFQ